MAFDAMAPSSYPQRTSCAQLVAQVDMDLCTQCNKCSLICPHAAVSWLHMALEVSLVVFTAFIVQVQRTHLCYSEQFIVAVTYCHTSTGWWFGTFFIFPYIGNSNPNWLIFFRGIETTNQIQSLSAAPSWLAGAFAGSMKARSAAPFNSPNLALANKMQRRNEIFRISCFFWLENFMADEWELNVSYHLVMTNIAMEHRHC